MFFSLFQNKPVLDETTVEWLFDTYAWALHHFDAQVFRDESVLVLPTISLPGGWTVSREWRISFRQVKNMPGVALADATGGWAPVWYPTQARLVIAGALRGSKGMMAGGGRGCATAAGSL